MMFIVSTLLMHADYWDAANNRLDRIGRNRVKMKPLIAMSTTANRNFPSTKPGHDALRNFLAVCLCNLLSVILLISRL